MSMITKLAHAHGTANLRKIHYLVLKNISLDNGKVEKLVSGAMPKIKDKIKGNSTAMEFANKMGIFEITGGAGNKDGELSIFATIILYIAAFLGIYGVFELLDYLKIDPPNPKPKNNPGETPSRQRYLPPAPNPNIQRDLPPAPRTGIIGSNLYLPSGEKFLIKRVYPGGDCLYESFYLGLVNNEEKSSRNLYQGITDTGETRYMIEHNRENIINELRKGFVDSIEKKWGEKKEFYNSTIIQAFLDDFQPEEKEFMYLKALHYPEERGFTKVMYDYLSSNLKNIHKLANFQNLDLEKDKGRFFPENMGDPEEDFMKRVILSKKIMNFPPVVKSLDNDFLTWKFFNIKNRDGLAFSYGDGNTLAFLASTYGYRIIVYDPHGNQQINTDSLFNLGDRTRSDIKGTIYLLLSVNHYDLLVPDSHASKFAQQSSSSALQSSLSMRQPFKLVSGTDTKLDAVHLQVDTGYQKFPNVPFPSYYHVPIRPLRVANFGGNVYHIISRPLTQESINDGRGQIVWVPHFWTMPDDMRILLGPTIKGKGELHVYSLNNGQFQETDDFTRYNNDKEYSIHKDFRGTSMVISDGLGPPLNVRQKILNEETLYVTYRWNKNKHYEPNAYDYGDQLFIGVYEFHEGPDFSTNQEIINNFVNFVTLKKRGGSEDIIRDKLGNLEDIIKYHHVNKTGVLRPLVKGLYPHVVGALEKEDNQEVRKIIKAVNSKMGGGLNQKIWGLDQIMGFIAVALVFGIITKKALMDAL